MKYLGTPASTSLRLAYRLILAASALSLAACGGSGGSSSGGSSAVGASLSSSVVVQVDRVTTAMLRERAPDGGPLGAPGDLFAARAVAQTAGIEVYFNGSLMGSTDGSGQLVVPVQPGTYEICFSGTAEEGAPCTEQQVLPDSVVVITDVNVDAATGDLTFQVATDSAQNNIVLFQDPDAAHKTLVCHKGRLTISVGTPAARTGHLAHGDSLGSCPIASTEPDNDPDGEPAATTPIGTGNGSQGTSGSNGCNGRGNPNCTG